MGMIDNTTFHSLFMGLGYPPEGPPRMVGRIFPSGIWFRAMDRWLIVAGEQPAAGGRKTYCVTDLAGDLNQLPEHARITAILDHTHARIFDDFPDGQVDGIDWHEINEHAAARAVEPREKKQIDRWM
jgi:hypothetical protein